MGGGGGMFTSVEAFFCPDGDRSDRDIYSDSDSDSNIEFFLSPPIWLLWLKISRLIRTLILDRPIFSRKVTIVTVTGLVTETVKVFSSSSVFLYLIWFCILPGL